MERDNLKAQLQTADAEVQSYRIAAGQARDQASRVEGRAEALSHELMQLREERKAEKEMLTQLQGEVAALREQLRQAKEALAQQALVKSE